MDILNKSGSNDVDLVFWPVGLAFTGLSFSQQLEAAAAGGFDGLALAPLTVRKALLQGLKIKDMLASAEDVGVKLTHVDGISTWVKNWFTAQDSDMALQFRAAFDVPVEEALENAQSLGMTRIVAVSLFDEGSMAIDEIIADFGRFCDLAASHGLGVDLEFIPSLGIPELPVAWHIVSAVNRDNAGICVDTWHLQKGSSDYERDMALLETIPGRVLKTVQLADANLASGEAETSLDAVTRKFPGEGELDITRILATIQAKGGLETVGAEIVGGRLSGLSMQEIGEVAGRTSRAALDLVYRR